MDPMHHVTNPGNKKNRYHTIKGIILISSHVDFDSSKTTITKAMVLKSSYTHLQLLSGCTKVSAIRLYSHPLGSRLYVL